MAIRLGESFHWFARHEKRLENSIFDEDRFGGGDTLVVEAIETAQVDVVEECHAGVIVDADKGGEDGLSDFLFERLAFSDILLAVTFDAVAEDFVEENGARAVAQDGGADIRLSQRGGAEGHHLVHYLAECFFDLRVVGEFVGRGCIEIVELAEVHAVFGFGGRIQGNAVTDFVGLQARSFAGHHVSGGGESANGDGRGVDLGIVAGDGGDFLQSIVPRLRIEIRCGGGFREDVGGFLAEVVRGVFLFDFHLQVG